MDIVHPRLVRVATGTLVLASLAWLAYGLGTHPVLVGGALVLAIGPLVVLLSVSLVARGIDRFLARDRSPVHLPPVGVDPEEAQPICRVRLPLTGLWIEVRHG